MMDDWTEKVKAAHDMVSAICRTRGSKGSREWIMSIPARPDYDPDLVITSGLMAAEKQIAAITAERDELKRRCEAMVAQRTLSKWRGVKMWKVPAVGESLIDIGTDQCVMSGGKFWCEDLVIAHNNDIVALNHCADILADELIALDKRVTAFCESIRNEGGDIFIGEKYVGWADTEGDATGIVDEIKSGLALAIAEGRDNG